MNGVVLDSSALLAYLNAEPGADIVEAGLSSAAMSAVNVAEVFTKLILRGEPVAAVRRVFDVTRMRIVEFDRAQAEDAGILVARTKLLGLSIGDRACLGLALREECPVLTTDRAWVRLGLGIEIRLIR